MKRSVREYIPLRRKNIEWSADESGLVTVFVENKGFFNKVLQILMKKPKRSFIHLDEKGSFFWLNSDGVRTLGEIAEYSAEKFGEAPDISFTAAEKFLEILCGCGFFYCKK